MSAHVIAITSSAGLPVFARKKGNSEALPFSTIGSLNGVHMFGKSLNVELLNTVMEDHNVVWKEFNDSIVLIAISSGSTVEVLNKLLESVFNAIVLIVGIDEIKSQRNMERLKRELRICYPIIDRLMDSLDFGDSTNKHSSELIMLAETILCTENHLIQIVLESYTECVDSVYSCILIHGKIAVATESWWSLHSDEIKLLSLLARIENTTNSKDIPVFLPYKSANVAYRFVACMIIPNVQVCSLCGPTPLLEDIEYSTSRCFKSTIGILESALQCHPKNFPNSFELDSGVLGILLINTKHNKYMISSNTTNKKSTSSGSHRLDILRTFYYQAVMKLVPETDGIVQQGKKEDKAVRVVGKEAYWCSEYHKCHAAIIEDNILCVLYNSTIPNYTMRLITPKVLKTFIFDKQVCW